MTPSVPLADDMVDNAATCDSSGWMTDLGTVDRATGHARDDGTDRVLDPQPQTRCRRRGRHQRYESVISRAQDKAASASISWHALSAGIPVSLENDNMLAQACGTSFAAADYSRLPCPLWTVRR